MSSYFNRERPRSPSVYRDARFLADCDPKEARDWLSRKPMEFSGVFGTIQTPPDCHVLEYILLRRCDAQIDLALAEYGRSRTVLTRIYRNGGDSIRVVACGNPSLFDGDGFNDLFHDDDLFKNVKRGYMLYKSVGKHGSLGELRALCENQYVDPTWLINLARWTGLFGDDSDQQDDFWSESRSLSVIKFLSNNPQLAISRDDSRVGDYWDGMSDYEYREMFNRLWQLPANAPTTPEWADVVSRFVSNLQSSHLRDLDKILDRWRIEVGEFEVDYYSAVREEIIKKVRRPSLDMLSDDDIAVRRAFYSTFDPEKPEFRELNWLEWVDDNPEIWLRVNENVWRTWGGRSNLYDVVSHNASDAVALGWHKADEKRYRETHPEWFEDESTADAKEEKLDDRLTALESVIHRVDEDVKEVKIRSSNFYVKSNRLMVIGVVVLILILISIWF
ncbi:hypothetical protein N9444_10360 [Gammaproteobacteria bacterium]|nr:hypothetical protein [Gammaproteobacteria bacterium]